MAVCVFSAVESRTMKTRADRTESIATLQAALDAGITPFDTGGAIEKACAVSSVPEPK